MATCPKIQKSKSTLCIGNMSKQIEIYTRDITVPINGTDYSQEFVLVDTVWSMVDTSSSVRGNYSSFDSVGQADLPTHAFFIRYNPTLTITTENWIKYNSEYYKIIDINNMNEENRFIRLRARKRGDENVQSNWV